MKNLNLLIGIASFLLLAIPYVKCQEQDFNSSSELPELINPTLPNNGEINDNDEIPVLDGSETAEIDPDEQPEQQQCVTGIYLTSSINCSSFLVCDSGKLKDVNCPPFMWFDPNYKGDTLCNYPEVVCAADNNVCDCSVEYPPLPPDPLIESDVSCLADNRFHMSGSKVNCGRYFICYNDNVVRQECRSGFHYNTKTEMCDYPELVNCKITDPDCPLDGISFLAHPNRMDAFYFCIHGFKTMQTCPFYHVWDTASVSCKRRDEI